MSSFKISKLPFYWRLSNYDDRNNNVVFDNFKFEFEFERNHNLLIQKRDPSLNEALNLVYQQEYNIGYLQDGNIHSKSYGSDFLHFLKMQLQNNNHIEKVLEIGCGGCFILKELKKDGYDVTGIDSSPFAAISGSKFDINVIQDFFPSNKLIGKFDLIFHVDVLEHIDDYKGFLSSQFDILNDDGLIIVNVPDASESIELGDCSMAMHQHLNYFSEDSLASVLCSAGFTINSVVKASYGGSLYAVASKVKPSHSKIFTSSNNCDTFTNNVSVSYNRILEKINFIRNLNNRSIGFYVPLRALPYISGLEDHEGLRFFDDTNHWHNKFFDGIDIPIENFEDLTLNPVTDLFIMSLTFGDVIKNKIFSRFGSSINVLTLRELLSNQ